MNSWHIKFDPNRELSNFEWLAIGSGFGVRVKLQLRTHRRRRINKKYLKRYGTVEFTIPSEVILNGHVQRYLRDTVALARRLDGKPFDEGISAYEHMDIDKEALNG